MNQNVEPIVERSGIRPYRRGDAPLLHAAVRESIEHLRLQIRGVTHDAVSYAIVRSRRRAGS